MRRLCPRRLGSFVQANAKRLLLLLGLALLVLCAAINSVKIDADLSSWIQRTSRVESELQAVESVIGEGSGTNSLLILQALNPHQSHKRHYQRHTTTNDILSVDSLMIHLETLAIATHVTVDLYEVTWSLKDLCFSPTLPDFEDMLVNKLLDKLMPCAIKTPLDCFWEGSKLLGPEQEVRLSSIGPRLKWTNLDPLLMIETKRMVQPHASFPYDALISWMKRTGINSGYMNRPCLDPNDPNCPASAPNKLTGATPDVGVELTNGCHGLASKQMHWREEELVGGVERNRSGYIVRADALQSTIQLMGERDVYEYWHNDVRVQNIHNWSVDKAKLVLEMWQQRFKDELAQFTKTSLASSPFKIQALTPKSMLEPIDASSILDLANFKLTIALFTIAICLMFPTFEQPFKSNIGPTIGSKTDASNHDERRQISQLKLITLAVLISIIVILTFVASLGLSSFMNLPFNMITTQILPSLALYHGFRQAMIIVGTYAKNFPRVSPTELTTECLNELLPIILFETMILILPLVVASALPVHATRVFCFQAVTYIALSTITAILLVPALLVTFLMRDTLHKATEQNDQTIQIIYKTKNLSIKCNAQANSAKPTIEELIFLRLQEDLRCIRAGTQQPMDNLTTQIPTHEPPEPDNQDLPDILRWSGEESSPESETVMNIYTKGADMEDNSNANRGACNRIIDWYANSLIPNKCFQAAVFLLSLALLAIIMPQSAKVRCGMQLRDIVQHGSADYDSLMMREKYFPVYNSFIVTQDDFEYESNQRLLYELHQQIEQIDSVVKSGRGQTNDQNDRQTKFWLPLFRDWLLELQDGFDAERNRSVISKDGWTAEASETAKLAYKLLAQTGRLDNPIDRNQVETSRLVDKNGIINQRAFYFYLTAWVMKDSFTYSNSEANFRPEPKTWNEEAENLRIERAKKLNFAQIPFLLKLPEEGDGLQTVMELRDISQAFTQLGVINFPTGIPFIFWDQFMNLDMLFVCTFTMLTLTFISIAYLVMDNLKLSLILTLPGLITTAELYSLLGFFAFQFNTVVAVILISLIATSTTQTTQCIMVSFQNKTVTTAHRIKRLFEIGFRTILANLILLLISALIFANSKLDFMIK